MNTYESFYDELAKIKTASLQQGPGIIHEVSSPGEYDPQGDPFITKDKLKRLAKVIAAMGAGGALASVAGNAIGNKLQSKWGVRRAMHAPNWLMEYGPAAVGALSGAAGMLALTNDPKRYIQYGDKPK